MGVKRAVMVFGAFGLVLTLSGCHYHHFRHHGHHVYGQGHGHGYGHHGQHHKKKHYRYDD